MIMALNEYQKALIIIPGQKKVADRIDEINRIKSSLAEKDNSLTGLLSEAENLFDKASYSEAKGKYNEILVIDPENEHAKARIDEIEKIQTAQREKENNYNKALLQLTFISKIRNMKMPGLNTRKLLIKTC